MNTLKRLASLLVATVLFAGSAVVSRSLAQAGHTLDNEDCWQTPGNCRATQYVNGVWSWVEGQYLNVLYEDQTGYPGMADPINTSTGAWTDAYGPQWFYSTGTYPSSSRPTLTRFYAPDWGANGVLGYTVNCPATGVNCSDVTGLQPSLVTFSFVYANWNYFNGWGSAKRQMILSHELGHTLGLAHHQNCDTCIMRVWDGWPNPIYWTPNTVDTGEGTANPCSGGRGIRCIFKWKYNNPSPGK